MLNLLKISLKNKNKAKLEEKKTMKHYPSPVREWRNSIYVYNKSALNLIPITTLSAIKLVRSFFNLYNINIERKMRTKRLLLRRRRLSQNKIFVSNGEFRHTNNKVLVTLYLFNRQRRSYYNRMKKLRFFKFFASADKKNIAKNIIKKTKLLILNLLKKINTNKPLLRKLMEYNKSGKKSFFKNDSASYNDNLSIYLNIFYKKFAKKSYLYLKTFFFYKQLVYINKTKHNYVYLKYLKTYLERLYNKNVEFNLVNVKRFFLNSDILSESISLKLTNKRKKILRYLKKIKKKIKISKKKTLIPQPVHNKIISEDYFVSKKDFGDNATKKVYVFSKLKHKNVTGFRLEARGRLTKRYTASRSLTKFRYKGNLLNIDSSHRGWSSVLLKGNLRSNLQLTKLKSKTRIGSFGIKGWVSGN